VASVAVHGPVSAHRSILVDWKHESRLAPILSTFKLKVRAKGLRECFNVLSPASRLTSAVEADPLSETRHSTNLRMPAQPDRAPPINA